MSALPYVLGGGAALGILLYALSSKADDTEKPTRPVKPPEPQPGGGGGKRRPAVFPPGSGEATVIPNTQGGIITRNEPSTRGGERTKLAPDGDPRLAYNGETVAVIETGIKEIGAPAGAPNEWWHIITPGGMNGFSRAVDGQGVRNFNLIRAPQGGGGAVVSTTIPGAGASAQGQAAVSGFDPYAAQRAYRPFGVAYGSGDPRLRGAQNMGTRARVMTCVAPSGAWLRPAPQAQGAAIVAPGTQVVVDEYLPGPKTDAASPGRGGFAKVRYLAPGSAQPVAGYVKSEWLA